MSIANYPGIQNNNTSYIKKFVTTMPSLINWTFKKSTNTISTESDVLIQGNLTVTGSINNPSDIKLKKDIQEISLQDIEKLDKLRPKKYSLIGDFKHNQRYGFIAQELEEEFPNLTDNVIEKNGEITKTINYIDLIPLLLMKIQTMQKEIAELKNK